MRRRGGLSPPPPLTLTITPPSASSHAAWLGALVKREAGRRPLARNCLSLFGRFQACTDLFPHQTCGELRISRQLYFTPTAAASSACCLAWRRECAIKPSERLRRAGFFFLFDQLWNDKSGRGCRLTGDKSRAEQRDQIDGRLLCGVGISGGFEVSPAAQVKGEELTFGPGGKRLSSVNDHKPNFPIAHQQSFRVCPAGFTGQLNQDCVRLDSIPSGLLLRFNEFSAK